MQLDTKILENGIKQITLTGRLDVRGTAEIDNIFTIQTTTKKVPVLVDISGVDFVASLGLQMLLNGAKGLIARGGKMVLLNPQPMVKNVFNVAGIIELIPIYDDFEAACADLTAAVTE